ncbi:DUF4239 domain-containing protein [Methylocapsa palsarum]|uniref:DUF4239 domain-containing protein n=1 Tax=Methylocapsa palsarum TaxID=1612308 RepID=A0A1I4BR37_9HYPH|nr:DUF4239 domain-containing protein [Methylocapsa palsarum]SFK71274.1 Protein of unknown function [Methylocapsa palsarum]
MIDAWLNLPLPLMLLAVTTFYCGSALCIYALCFGPRTRNWILSFRETVPELFSAIMVIFSIQLGFLTSDIWDINRRAATAVETESASLTMLRALAADSGLPIDGIHQAIRVYVTAVTEKEWPSMAQYGGGVPEAEEALGALLRTVASTHHDPNDANAKFDALLLDTALKVQSARAARLVLSAPFSESTKWACVLLLALAGQISIALLHLDKRRPHVAAMVILTSSIVLIIGLVAANEGPFQPPIYVSSDPIAKVGEVVLDPRAASPPPLIPSEAKTVEKAPPPEPVHRHAGGGGKKR